VIQKLEWTWDVTCVRDQPAELVVTITATDDDTPGDQLTYSGKVDDCTDITAAVSTLSCGSHGGLRGGPATVTDPQGNEDELYFAFDNCQNGSCDGDQFPCP